MVHIAGIMTLSLIMDTYLAYLTYSSVVLYSVGCSLLYLIYKSVVLQIVDTRFE